MGFLKGNWPGKKKTQQCCNSSLYKKIVLYVSTVLLVRRLGDKIWPNHVRLKHLKWDQDLWLMRNPKVP